MNAYLRRAVVGALLLSLSTVSLVACNSTTGNTVTGGARTGSLSGELTMVNSRAPASDADGATIAAIRGPWSDGSVDVVVAALGHVGIAVVRDPSSTQPITAVQGKTVLTLLQWQVHSMTREAHLGGGIPGQQLDDSLPAPVGSVQYSSFIAAWTSHWDSPRARLAHAIIGTQDWSSAAGITWPALVLTLFQADATEAAAQDVGSVDPLKGLPPSRSPDASTIPADGAAAPPSDVLPSGAPQAAPTPTADAGVSPDSPVPTASTTRTDAVPGAVLAAYQASTSAGPAVGAGCQAVSTFVSSIIDNVAAALKVNPASVNGGGRTGTAVLTFFAALWNIAVTTLQVVVNGAVQVFNATVLGWLRAGIGVVALVAQLATLFKPLDLHVNGSPSSATFAVDSAPDVTGTVAGYLNEPPDLTPYPSYITGCADAAGVTLPQRGINGANYRWTLVDPNHLVTTTTPTEGVAANDYVTVHWTTGRETSIDAGSGDTVTQPVIFTLTLDNRVLRAAADALRAAALAAVGNLGPAGAAVSAVLTPYLDRAINVIVANVGLSRSYTLPITHSKHVTCKA